MAEIWIKHINFGHRIKIENFWREIRLFHFSDTLPCATWVLPSVVKGEGIGNTCLYVGDLTGKFPFMHFGGKAREYMPLCSHAPKFQGKAIKIVAQVGISIPKQVERKLMHLIKHRQPLENP